MGFSQRFFAAIFGGPFKRGQISIKWKDTWLVPPLPPQKNPWVFTTLASGQDESLLRIKLDVPADFQAGDAILVECLDF